MENKFVRLDCDNVGDKIEFALYTNNTSEAQIISDLIKENIAWMIMKLVDECNATILLVGSDDLLFKIDANRFDVALLKSLKSEFYRRSNITLSIGIGDNIKEAMVNLQIAKVSGKDRIVT